MPLKYEVPPGSSPLMQGEILGDICEHRVLAPPIPMADVEFTDVAHPLMIVMNPACDLEWDFKARFPDQQIQDQDQLDTETNDRNLVPHVLLCEAYKREAIRILIPARHIWERIEKNQDERHHHFEPAPIGDPPIGELEDLYLDFKKTLALPTASLYKGLHSGGVKRVAVVPPIYIHALMHRFYGFLSRVGLPE